MSNKQKGTTELKITYINPNDSKNWEKLLRKVIIEKIKNENVIAQFLKVSK